MSDTNELDQLHGLAAEADAAALPPPAEVQALDAAGNPLPPPPDFLTEAQGAVDMFSALVVGWCPKAETIWSPETKGRIAGALAPVMEKYGFSFGSMPPELMLIIVAGPPLWQSSRMVAEQINEDRAKKAEQAGQQPAAAVTAQAEESPEVLRHAQMGLYPQ